MTRELKNKLTERFNTLSSKVDCDEQVKDALLKAYLAGGEYGYQYAVDKACEWLTNYFVNYLQFDKQIISDFRKAMEEWL